MIDKKVKPGELSYFSCRYNAGADNFATCDIDKEFCDKGYRAYTHCPFVFARNVRCPACGETLYHHNDRRRYECCECNQYFSTELVNGMLKEVGVEEGEENK